MIEIKPNPIPTPGQPAVFSPRNAVANAGDTIAWHNADTQAHWPAPSASNPEGWSKHRTPAGSESDSLSLGPNTVLVTAATNANPVVFTTDGPAPPSGTTVTVAAASPSTSPWALNKNYVATNLGAKSCSIPVDSTTFGPLTITLTISWPGAYTLNYVCALHPTETGSITVNPQP